MVVRIPPVPLQDISQLPYSIQEWFRKVQALIGSPSGLIPWANVDKTGSNLTDLVTRNHNDLQNKQGGTTSEYYHLTSARNTTLTGTQAANKVFAGPSSGPDAIADFRVLTTADLPAGTGTVTSITAGTGLTGGTITTSGTIALANPITGFDLEADTVTTYLDFKAVADPATPAVGYNRLYAFDDHGITRLRFDNEMTTDQVINEDMVYVVKNVTGSPLTKGTPVYISGDAGNVPSVAKAKADAVSTMPALGLIYDDIADGEFGQVMHYGTLQNYNTNAWAPGTRLYVSPTVAGTLTSTRPSWPNYGFAVGVVMAQGVGNGSILVSATNAIAGRDTGTTGTWGFSQYADFVAQGSNPPAPPAGVVRFHSATTQGFTRFEQDNEAPTNLVLGRDNVFIAKNTSGSSIAAGKPVYITGSTGNVPNISLAKADVITTLPAVGIALDTIGNNNFGQVMKLGVISNIDTSAFSTGAQLYVSPTTAGGLTATRPVSPNLVQRIGSVLVSGVGNGSILVTVAPFIGGLESGTTSTAFAANTITGNGLFQYQFVDVGVTLTVPVNYSMVVAGNFTVNGDLVINGDMRVM